MWQPDKGEFNISVETLNVDGDLERKLVAQERSLGGSIFIHY
jgi:hypothetical protein